MSLVSFIYSIDLIAAICFISGFVLVVVEMFHPGFGVPGIAGTVLLLIGIVMTARSLLDILIMVIILIAILGFALTIVLNSVTKGRLSKTLVNHASQKKEAGYIGTEDLDYFLGHKGTASTVLRPAGTGDFGGIKLDVVSQGEFIAKDKAIEIIKVEGRKIVVKEIKKG